MHVGYANTQGKDNKVCNIPLQICRQGLKWEYTKKISCVTLNIISQVKPLLLMCCAWGVNLTFVQCVLFH